MWCVATRGISGYVIVYTGKGGEGRKKVYQRKDGFINHVLRFPVIFTDGKTDFEKFLLKNKIKPVNRIIDIAQLLNQKYNIDTVYQILRNLEEEGIEIDRYTLGSLAAQFLYGLPDEIRRLKGFEKDLAEKAFFGGRVENLVQEYESPSASIVYYDINSAYPYLLSNSLIPKTYYTPEDKLNQPLYTLYEDIDLRTLKILHEKGMRGIVEVEVDEYLHLPRLPVKVGEIYYPIGKIKGTYHSVEVVYQFTEADRIRIKKAYMYKAVPSPFKPAIDQVWTLRQTYKPVHKETAKTFKYISNAIWGVISKKEPPSNRFIGGYITALQRVRLMGKVRQLINRGFKVLYYDTDGIIVDVGNRREEADRIIGLSDGKFGGWDVRYDGIKKIEAGGVKQYRIIFGDGREEVVWKGIPEWEDAQVVDVVSGKIEVVIRKSGWANWEKEKLILNVFPKPKRKFIRQDYSLPFNIEELKEEVKDDDTAVARSSESNKCLV